MAGVSSVLFDWRQTKTEPCHVLFYFSTIRVRVCRKTRITGSGSAWVVYRIYLPDEGQNSMGGVTLPNVTLTNQNGNSETLKPCAEVNAFSDLSVLENELYPFSTVTNSYISPDRLWFAPPNQPPPSLFPNPDNKYITATPGNYQPGRIIVARGKAPAFPDTYSGGDVWQPANHSYSKGVQLRYWALCVNDYTVAFPVVQCMTDINAPLDHNGFYTVVISDDQFAPSWLPANVSWCPGETSRRTKRYFSATCCLPAASPIRSRTPSRKVALLHSISRPRPTRQMSRKPEIVPRASWAITTLSQSGATSRFSAKAGGRAVSGRQG